jgi:hypothetical protein
MHMMYWKARTFGDDETAARILRERDPRKCKRLGRDVRGFDEKKWDTVCEEVVYRGNLSKFSHHEPLRRLLLATGDRWLAEASPYDKKWGIGLSQHDERALDPSQWRGTNLLGNALMRVRKTLAANASDKSTTTSAVSAAPSASASASASASSNK